MASSFPWQTPYCAMDNDPINKIDPTGMAATKPDDWYKDNNGAMQFDPNVKSQADVGSRGTYVGATKTETSSRGSKVEYRKDGSILFNNENDAYDRMKTIGVSREAMIAYTGSKTLYLPDYKNDISTSETKEVGYEFKNGKVHDPITRKDLSISATMHTHLSLFKGKTWGDETASNSDKYKFAKETPNIPFLTLAPNNIYGYFGNWQPGKDGKYQYNDAKVFQFMQVPSTQLYNGLKNIVQKNRAKYGNY